jgi:hypothetical protein
VYLVDEAGVRTNFSENFMDMNYDFTLDVLYNDCRHGEMYMDECDDLLSEMRSSLSLSGTQWKIFDLVIIQENVHGLIRYPCD